MCHFLLRIVINMWFWFALCHVFLRYLYGIYGMYHGSFWLLFLQAKKKSSHFWETTYWWMPLKATMLASLPMVRRVSNGVLAGGQGAAPLWGLIGSPFPWWHLLVSSTQAPGQSDLSATWSNWPGFFHTVNDHTNTLSKITYLEIVLLLP